MIIVKVGIDGHEVCEIHTKFARNAVNIMHVFSEYFDARFQIIEEVDEEDLVDEDSET